MSTSAAKVSTATTVQTGTRKRIRITAPPQQQSHSYKRVHPVPSVVKIDARSSSSSSRPSQVPAKTNATTTSATTTAVKPATNGASTALKTVTTVKTGAATAVNTAELWKELHLHALQHKDGVNDLVWVVSWSRKIPRFSTTGGCKCKEHFQKWFNVNRPNFTTRDTFFAWTVKAHNEVNKRLNRPEYTVEQAMEHYSKLLQAETETNKK